VLGHAVLSVTLGSVEVYAAPSFVIVAVSDEPMNPTVAAAFDTGGAIIIFVGMTVQFALESSVTPLKVISLSTHFSMTDVALIP
jgi:hypothetical protein